MLVILNGFAVIVAAVGLVVFGAVAIICFRAAATDGDRTPAGNGARVCAFVAGMIFTALALLPVADLIGIWLAR